MSPNLSENSIEAFLHRGSKLLCAMAWGSSNTFASLLKGPQWRQIPGLIRSHETTHTRGNPVLPAKLGKVTLPQGDWQSSQDIGNYLMRLVCVSHLGLESHVRWSKQYAVHENRIWSIKPYFQIFRCYSFKKLKPKPREVLTGGFSLSVTGLYGHRISLLLYPWGRSSGVHEGKRRAQGPDAIFCRGS